MIPVTSAHVFFSVTGLSAFAAVVYSYSLWTTLVFHAEPDSLGHCVPSITYFQFLNIAGHIDAIVTLVLPFLVIAFLNIRIVFAMIYYLRYVHYVVILTL